VDGRRRAVSRGARAPAHQPGATARARGGGAGGRRGIARKRGRAGPARSRRRFPLAASSPAHDVVGGPRAVSRMGGPVFFPCCRRMFSVNAAKVSTSPCSEEPVCGSIAVTGVPAALRDPRAKHVVDFPFQEPISMIAPLPVQRFARRYRRLASLKESHPSISRKNVPSKSERYQGRYSNMVWSVAGDDRVTIFYKNPIGFGKLRSASVFSASVQYPSSVRRSVFRSSSKWSVRMA